MDNNVKRSREDFAAGVSVAGAAVVFLISLAAGIICDSVTLLLDASTGLVIVLVSVFVRRIIQKIGKPPDDSFNFGYDKYEPLTVLLQNAAIIITCLLGVKFALQDIIHPEDIVRYDIPVLAALSTCLIALALGLYIRKVSRYVCSSVLKTSSSHWFIDAAFSLGMFLGFLAGAVLGRLGFTRITPYVDPVMAILLALLLVRIPLLSIPAHIRELLDAVPSAGIQEKIRELACQQGSDVLEIERVRVRKAGRKLFLDVCLLVSGELTVRQARLLAENLERRLIKEYSGCDCVVYFKHR